jgi:competence protein ComEC
MNAQNRRVDIAVSLSQSFGVPGESKNQFSLTHAAPGIGGRAKSNFLSVIALTIASLLAAGTVSSTSAGEPGKLVVTFFDMPKHGIAIAVQTPKQHVYLVDTGIEWEGHDTGRDILAPFLRERKVNEIAGIVHTHPHRDHYGGTPWLLEHFKVKRVIDSGYDKEVFLRNLPSSWDYPKLLKLVPERGSEHQVVKAGDKLKWDDALEVEVLAPPKEFLKHPKDVELEINDNSVVIRMRHGKNVFLFSGDIGELGQDYLLEKTGAEKLKCTVLAVPHHGFDCFERFATVVKPAVAVASCLKDYPKDSLRSPGQRTSEVYGAAGAQVYVTAWHGNVQVTSDGETCTVKTDRTR